MQPELDSPSGSAVAIDLDGTLVDSAPDLAAAANRTLQAMGARRLPTPKIRAMIGDGIDMLVRRCLAASLEREASPAELAEACQMMRSFYREEVFCLSRVYPGVTDVLSRWQASGLVLACVTNKASNLTRPLLRESGLAGYFTALYCADEPPQRKPSPLLLLQFLREAGVAAQRCVMIGDSVHDIMAAQAAEVRAIAVTYGYGDPHASAVAPWRTVSRPGDLVLQ
jgi:phosphoglycolate phosphatase